MMRLPVPRSRARASWAAFVAATLAVPVASCGNEDPPTDCGDPSMSIVTFRGASSSEKDEARICIDIHAASRADATATSRGLDDSLATSRPNVIPWTNLTFGEAVEACSRAGKFLCNSDELRSIAPSVRGMSGAEFDETMIDALSPTSGVTEMPHQFNRLNRYDLLSTPDKIPYPESTGSVAFWTASPKGDDKEVDPSIPLMLGRIVGARATGGILFTSPVLDPAYKHPLLGFRCCIHAKMRPAFEALPPDPRKVRGAEDEEVPLAPTP